MLEIKTNKMRIIQFEPVFLLSPQDFFDAQNCGEKVRLNK